MVEKQIQVLALAGNDATTWQGTIGRFGPGELNKNGERLLDFCALNDMVVTNMLFQHRLCHQHTWFHSAQSSRSGHMLDYVLVSQQFRSSILDTRVYRKTNLESDHRLVVSKVRLKLKARRRRAQRYLGTRWTPVTWRTSKWLSSRGC